jgi:hypothetical protein
MNESTECLKALSRSTEKLSEGSHIPFYLADIPNIIRSFPLADA